MDKPTQHLDSMPCGVGPSPASKLALLNLSEGPECVVPSLHRFSALSVAPAEFHAQHFTKSSEESGGHTWDFWMWFFPVESKDHAHIPFKHNEPILFTAGLEGGRVNKHCPNWNIASD